MAFGTLLTAMVTPFDKNMEVDYDKAQQLAEFLSGHGSDGLVVAGTTGESPTLSQKEKLRLIQAVQEAVGPETAVIAGTGTNSTAESAAFTSLVSGMGVDGVMVVAPYYNKPSQEGLYQHFKTVADASEAPVILYNVPGRTGCNLLPETVMRLSEHPQIAAVKEASGSLEQVTRIRASVPEQFLIYSGDDSLTLPILSVGGNGVISVASHVAGEEIRRMINAYQAGDCRQAADIHLRLFPLFRALFAAPNPVPVKFALNELGMDVGSVRLPLTEMGEREKALVREALAKLK